MSGNRACTIDICDKEVLSEEVKTIVKSFPVWNRISTDTLENDCLCGTIDAFTLLFIYPANNAAERIRFLVMSDGKIVDNFSCKSRVSKTVCRTSSTKIILKAVASVKELANVFSDVMSQHKTTTRMLIDEFFYIKHQFVHNYQLSTSIDSLIELTPAH